MFTIGEAVSTSDNDQEKPAGKDYVNVKPVWPVCVCVAPTLQQTRKTNYIYQYIYIYIYTYIYQYMYIYIYIYLYINI